MSVLPTLARYGVLLLAVGLTPTLIGCGDSGDKAAKMISVRGRITEGNKPWTMESAKLPKLPPGVSAPPTAKGAGAPAGTIQVGFHSAEGNDVVYGVCDAAAGTFEARIAPGRYKISLTMGSAMPGVADPFGGKFTQDKTPILRDLTTNGDEVVIDITKPKG